MIAEQWRGVLLAGLLAASGARAASVGFQRIGGLPFDLAIWYPTEATPSSPTTLMLLTQDVATDAPVSPGRHKLVVISHGNGGSLASHLDTALALAAAGFVVAAPTHPGDNYRDRSRETAIWERPATVSAAIDYVTRRWRDAASVDDRAIGVFGFSAGGFTALALIGGRPDFSRVGPYCVTHAATFTCRIVSAHGGVHAPAPLPGTADPRIRAAVIAAPAVGFAFGRPGLAAVRVPVQLWAAADDHVLPVADNAGAVRDALPTPPEWHLVAGADHFDFLPPCSAELARVAPPICAATPGFDRAAFHRSFDAAVVAFFRRTLGPA